VLPDKKVKKNRQTVQNRKVIEKLRKISLNRMNKTKTYKNRMKE